MGRKKTLLLVPVGLAVIALLAASAAMGRTSASDTLVFGTASDPVVLDGPLVSDGESLRPIDQIFEGLASGDIRRRLFARSRLPAVGFFRCGRRSLGCCATFRRLICRSDRAGIGLSA